MSLYESSAEGAHTLNWHLASDATVPLCFDYNYRIPNQKDRINAHFFTRDREFKQQTPQSRQSDITAQRFEQVRRELRSRSHVSVWSEYWLV